MATTEVQATDLLTVPEVARLLRVGESTVRAWIARREVPFIALPGGEYRVPGTELFRGLRSNVDAEAILSDLSERLRSVADEDLRGEIAAVRRERLRSRG